MGDIAYHIQYRASTSIEGSRIDSVLADFNNHFSHYISSSELSRFNKEGFLVFQDSLWRGLLEVSKQVYRLSDGAFDPSIGSVIDLWGLGPNQREGEDWGILARRADSLLDFVGFSHVEYGRKEMRRLRKGLTLDFSAIAKGYAVDILREFLREEGIGDGMIEIGGEVGVWGQNMQKNPWRIGIESPLLPSSGKPLVRLALSSGSVATSGNYRRQQRVGNRRYSHTLHPQTGRPWQSDILSATIWVNEDASGGYKTAYADAFATACMVMGREASLRLLEAVRGVEGLLVVGDSSAEEGLRAYATKGFEEKKVILSASLLIYDTEGTILYPYE